MVWKSPSRGSVLRQNNFLSPLRHQSFIGTVLRSEERRALIELPRVVCARPHSFPSALATQICMVSRDAVNAQNNLLQHDVVAFADANADPAHPCLAWSVFPCRREMILWVLDVGILHHSVLCVPHSCIGIHLSTVPISCIVCPMVTKHTLTLVLAGAPIRALVEPFCAPFCC